MDNTTTQLGPSLISKQVADIITLINISILSFAFALLGIFANAINIFIFSKLGFADTANISLTGLAIADLCSMVTLVWFDLCMNPLMVGADLPFVPSEIQYLTGAWPHGVFGRISSWITVYIMFERCICIALPLKVKIIFNPKRTVVIIVCIFLILCLSVVPVYCFAYFDWKFIPNENSSRVGIYFMEEGRPFEKAIRALSAGQQVVAYCLAVILTTVLVHNLNKKSQFRKSATSVGDKEKSDTLSSRDQTVVKMVVLIAVILIVCCMPETLLLLTTSMTTKVGMHGRYKNIYFFILSIAFTGKSINSSVNILVYYRMSSKFREKLGTFIRGPDKTGKM